MTSFPDLSTFPEFPQKVMDPNISENTKSRFSR